jgi:glycosyltransferase involved in cell wall biosynthesis
MDSGPSRTLVSVVLPVHSTPPAFLREAIESVRGQLEVNWELVIVMDAATEGCAEAAHELADLDPARIRLVGDSGGTPRGASAARSLGIARTRGPILAFLDADDLYEPNALASRLSLLETYPDAAMVYGTTLYWYSWTGNPADRKRDYVPHLGVEAGSVHVPPTLLSHFLDGTATVPCPCSILVRRWAIEASGGFDETFPGLYDDQVFYARLLLRFPVLADDRVLDRYRQHAQSMTAQANHERARETRTRFLDWLEAEAEATGVRDPVLSSTIAHERWKIVHPTLARLIRTARRMVRRLVTAGPSSASRVQQ